MVHTSYTLYVIPSDDRSHKATSQTRVYPGINPALTRITHHNKLYIEELITSRLVRAKYQPRSAIACLNRHNNRYTNPAIINSVLVHTRRTERLCQCPLLA